MYFTCRARNYGKNLLFLRKSSLYIYFSEQLNTFPNIFQRCIDLKMSERIIDLDGFCCADYATFLILKIGLLEVDLWHFSFGKVAIKFTFPPQFLLVSEKRKISKFEP